MLDRRERRVPGEAGIWVFIFGELLVFGLLFGAFVYQRAERVAVFDEGRRSLDTTLGVLNTLVLLSSSLFVVFGVRAVRDGVSTHGAVFFALAWLCGLAFVLDKFVEYSELTGAGNTPGTNAFFMYFYLLTGIHLLHVVIGMCVLGFLWRKARPAGVRRPDIRALENGASYWHMVELLWLVLFALLYLMG
jgi:nitric oxide reductase NorE protein